MSYRDAIIGINVAGQEQLVRARINYALRPSGGVRIYGCFAQFLDQDGERTGVDLLPFLSDQVCEALGRELLEEVEE